MVTESPHCSTAGEQYREGYREAIRWLDESHTDDVPDERCTWRDAIALADSLYWSADEDGREFAKGRRDALQNIEGILGESEGDEDWIDVAFGQWREAAMSFTVGAFDDPDDVADAITISSSPLGQRLKTRRAARKGTGDAKPVELESLSTSGQDALDGLLGALDGGQAKPLVKLVSFPEFELGLGLVTVLGAPPAAGKTLLSMQMMFEGIEYDDDLIAYVLNCEMTPQSLLRRELSRLTGIPAKVLRFGNLNDGDRELIRKHTEGFWFEGKFIEGLRKRLERVRFVRADAEGLAHVAKAKPGVVLIDYVQRFSIGKERDPRQMMNVVMDCCRQLADQGHAVLAISATKRSSEGQHSNKELSLSSFRESGEIEYSSDAAYVLKTSLPNQTPYRSARLDCVKNRNGEPVSLDLMLDTNSLSFVPAAEVNEFLELTSGGNPFEGDDDDQ